MKIIKQAFTFDDVLLVPAHSKVMPKEVNLNTKLTKNISLNTPIISAAMDTVTESRLAITIAQEATSRNWFIVGALVLLIGIIFGFIIQRMTKPRRF